MATRRHAARSEAIRGQIHGARGRDGRADGLLQLPALFIISAPRAEDLGGNLGNARVLATGNDLAEALDVPRVHVALQAKDALPSYSIDARRALARETLVERVLLVRHRLEVDQSERGHVHAEEPIQEAFGQRPAAAHASVRILRREQAERPAA